MLGIGGVEKTAILIFFSKFFYFASSPWKLVTNYVLEWMGLNFYYYDGLQPKMSPGIINEHECRNSKLYILRNCDVSIIVLNFPTLHRNQKKAQLFYFYKNILNLRKLKNSKTEKSWERRGLRFIKFLNI